MDKLTFGKDGDGVIKEQQLITTIISAIEVYALANGFETVKEVNITVNGITILNFKLQDLK